MVTKYSIGDKVYIAGEVMSIRVDKNGKNADILYNICIKDGLLNENILQYEKDVVSSKGRVPIEALKDLHERMDKTGVVADGKSNILDTCKALLMEVIEAYDVKEDK